MDSIPVTLIVKAPNQQIEDQTIKCELSWTINKLKQHLSEVYPNKPPKHEQKLIYSGQLLPDSVVLKDVLRQYDGQETHTVHLVCTTKQFQQTQKPPVTPRIQHTMPEASTSTHILTSDSNPEQVPNIQWPNMAPIDPNQYALQMAWMQQAYMQYMNQYMNMSTNTQVHNHQIAAEADIPDEPQVQPPAQAQPEAENVERDWLDLLYVITRALVLFSVVYFYSSPLRFVFVICLGVAFYLYQIGFFRNLNNNNNNLTNNNVQNVQGNEEIQNPSYLMVMWTFVTTFFASLIPETPQGL